MKPRREGLPLTRDEWSIVLEALDIRVNAVETAALTRDETKRLAKLVRGMSVMRRG